MALEWNGLGPTLDFCSNGSHTFCCRSTHATAVIPGIPVARRSDRLIALGRHRELRVRINFPFEDGLLVHKQSINLHQYHSGKCNECAGLHFRGVCNEGCSVGGASSYSKLTALKVLADILAAKEKQCYTVSLPKWVPSEVPLRVGFELSLPRRCYLLSSGLACESVHSAIANAPLQGVLSKVVFCSSQSPWGTPCYGR